MREIYRHQFITAPLPSVPQPCPCTERPPLPMEVLLNLITLRHSLQEEVLRSRQDLLLILHRSMLKARFCTILSSE